MKRLKALSIITAMLFTLTACGSDKDDDSKGTTAANTTENIIVSEPTETATVDNTTTGAGSIMLLTPVAINVEPFTGRLSLFYSAILVQ